MTWMTVCDHEKTSCYWDTKKLILMVRSWWEEFILTAANSQTGTIFFSCFILFLSLHTFFSSHLQKEEQCQVLQTLTFHQGKKKESQRRRMNAPFVLQAEQRYLSGRLSSVSGVSVDMWHTFCLLWFERFNPEWLSGGFDMEGKHCAHFSSCLFNPLTFFPSSWWRKPATEINIAVELKQVDFIFIIVKASTLLKCRKYFSLLKHTVNIAFSFCWEVLEKCLD